MPFRRKPKATKQDPKKEEFTFQTGAKKVPEPSPVSKRRPPFK